MTERNILFHKRTNYSFVKFNGLYQLKERTCVFASIAGAVNYLCNYPIWDIYKLYHAHNGPIDFSIAKTAVEPVKNEIASYRYHRGITGFKVPLSITKVEEWLDKEAVVILSLELSKDQNGTQREGKWHMFTLISRVDDKFQVWDTNGFEGYFYKEELINGFQYDGRWCVPHLDADCLVLKAKK